MKQGQTFYRLLKYLHGQAHRLIIALALALAYVAATLYTPVLIGRGVDMIVGAGNVDFDGLLRVVFGICTMIALSAASQWGLELCTNKLSYSMAADIRADAFASISRVPVKYIDSHPHGDIMSRLVTDVDAVSDGLLMGFKQLFTGVLTIIGTIAFMFSIDALIAAVVLVITPLSLFVARFVASRTHAMFTRQSKVRGEMTALVNEMVGNVKVVKAFNHEPAAQARFDDINEELRVCGIRAIFFSSITNPTTRFVNNVVYACVGIIGAISAINGRLSVGQLTSFLSYANQYTKPFNEISGVIAEFQGALASAARVFELTEARRESADPPGAAVLSEPEGAVALKDVSFSYDPEVELIRDLSLEARPGTRVAIVGPTGSGKTTLINLLMRFYDVDGGEILIDGRPATSITRDSLRKNFGMVLQDSWLRTGTIRENIAYGTPDATEDEIVAAAVAAHAHGFITRLNGGYDARIVGDGGNLSQGEKQLICIARAMLRLPRMLILDEATSSIDTLTELRIQRAFAEMMRGRTSFVVAHRLSTIREADSILVMREGRIVEQGSHDALMRAGGFYAGLYNSQFEA